MWHVWKGKEMHTGYRWQNIKEKYHLKDERILLN
jgi:hypothetical protein